MRSKTHNKKGLLLFIYTLISLFFILLGARLVQFQIIDNEVITTQADHRISRKIILPAKRGMITDRDGGILAFSLETSSVIFTKSKSVNVNEEINALRNVVSDLNIEETLELIKNEKEDDVVIVENLSYSQAKLVKRLDLNAMALETSINRVYPNKTLASHILGYTDIDGKGLHGLEYTQHDFLKGKDGYIEARTDGSGRKLASSDANVIAPIDGYTIETTIDTTIQYYVENAIKSGCEISNATKVMAVVQDAKNGDILAMASYPDYDPNQHLTPIYDVQKQAYQNREAGASIVDVMSKYWRNPIIQEVYEPGSTFKIFTGTVGLEEGATSYNSTYYCSGSTKVTGKTIKCWKRSGHGKQNLVEGFRNSCNIVFMSIVESLGKEKVYDYLQAYQLDQKSGVPLNGEASPLLTPLKRLRPVDLARIGFGHNISLTPLQMMKVLGVTSNEGVLVQPRLIKRVLDDQGNVVEAYNPRVVGQIISKKTANQVLGILENVVTEGSGKNAYIAGYRIGGKTGTSIKLINGRYEDDKKVFSSFAAIAPIDDPAFNLIVIVDEPKTENVHGSTVATPIAREILLNVLQYMQIEPKDEITTETTTVPNLIGMPLKKALSIATSKHIRLVNGEQVDLSKLKGDFTIVKQYPLSGSLISREGEIFIQLKKSQSE